MGEHADTDARGTFYLRTNAKPPYSRLEDEVEDQRAEIEGMPDDLEAKRVEVKVEVTDKSWGGWLWGRLKSSLGK